MGTNKEPDLAPSKPSSPKARDRQPTRRPWRNNSEKNCLLPGGKWCDGDGSWAMDTLLFSYAYDLLLNWKKGSDTGWPPSTQMAIFTIQKFSLLDRLLTASLSAAWRQRSLDVALVRDLLSAGADLMEARTSAVDVCFIHGSLINPTWHPVMVPGHGTPTQPWHPSTLLHPLRKLQPTCPILLEGRTPYSYCYLWLKKLGWLGLKRPSLVRLVAFGIFSFLMLEVNWDYSVLDLAHWRVFCSSNLPFLLNIWWCLPQDSRSGAAAGDGESMDEDEKADSFNLRASLGWTNCDMEVI